ADRNRSHWSTSKTPSYTKSVSWQHYQPVIHNKDWRFKRFAVELPPSLRVTKVVNHKPRIGKPSVAFTWDRVKN
ncbi:hypothetical protein, partial [Escherichia coli]|uniref:hypothetical protein n=1 Tax=Escherichia coli TaxID=562 RepID=UPI001BFE9DF0